jgi:hypothetical protein
MTEAAEDKLARTALVEVVVSVQRNRLLERAAAKATSVLSQAWQMSAGQEGMGMEVAAVVAVTSAVEVGIVLEVAARVTSVLPPLLPPIIQI